MGDPKKQRKKYGTPRHPWKAERINEENKIQEEYGLKNKTELWKMDSILKKLKEQAKRLISVSGEQAEKEEQLFRKRLEKMGLISEGVKIENVLDLTVKELLERRLQTQVCRKGFAKSIKQARQFITHGHVLLNGKKVNAPSYLLLHGEENMLTFRPTSALSDAEHPERKLSEKNAAGKAEESEEEKNDTKE
ncbi:MAG: 30S ribosomal protein S4 [Nanoarchaeota archaeon]|nr:30S ribosomal protein S4 [Nanoarchaeota archaeon]